MDLREKYDKYCLNRLCGDCLTRITEYIISHGIETEYEANDFFN